MGIISGLRILSSSKYQYIDITHQDLQVSLSQGTSNTSIFLNPIVLDGIKGIIFGLRILSSSKYQYINITHEDLQVSLGQGTCNTFSCLNPIVLEGIKGIISGLTFFPDIAPIPKMRTYILQLLAKFQQVQRNENFWTLIP